MPSEQESLKDSQTNLGQEQSTENNSRRSFSIDKSDDSSELSDLDEDQSEAETDKMDFLRPENSSNENVSDLNTLSKLTELARLQEIDSDFEDNEQENGKEIDNGNDDDNENSNGDNSGIEPVKEEHGDKALDEEQLSRKEARKSPSEDSRKSKKIKLDVVDEALDADGESEAESDSEKAAEPVGAIDDSVETKVEETEGHEELEEEHEEHEDDHEDEHEDEHEDDHEDNEDDHEDENGIGNGETKEGGTSESEDDDFNKQRQLAVEELIEIEQSFVDIRDKLFQDKLKSLEHELQLCLDGSHPELSKIYYKINGFYQDSLRLANNTLTYRLKCINSETIATRTSIHQDFLRHLMDGKNEMILNTTSQWYKINKERNQMDQLVPDYAFAAIPERHTDESANGSTSNGSNGSTNVNGMANMETSPHPEPLLKKAIKQQKLVDSVQNRNNLNQQLGILNSLVQFHGIPSAINLSDNDNLLHELLLTKANDDEIAEDLAAMGIPI